MYLRKHYRTIVLSDIHLGTTHSKVEEVSQLLRSVNCDKLILNGDIIDGWHMKKNGTRKWLALLGDMGYTFLLWFNGWYNKYRTWRGKPYFSLSQRIKQKVKSAVSYISDFEKTLSDFALARKYDGIICGHIHHPDNTYYGKIHYLNSGDWVETMSALAEDENGNWSILYYSDVEIEPALAEENRTTIQSISSAS